MQASRSCGRAPPTCSRRTRTRRSCPTSTAASCPARGRRRSKSSASPTIRPSVCSGWLATVSETALQRARPQPAAATCCGSRTTRHAGKASPTIVVGEIERRTLLGDVDGRACAGRSARARDDGRRGGRRLRAGATRSVERARRPAARAARRRQPAQGRRRRASSPLNRLCHTIGAGVVRPLAEALAVEENSRRHPAAARAPARLRRRRPAVGRAAEELPESGGAAHGDRSAARLRRPARRCPSWRRCSTTPTRRCSASRSAPSCRSARNDAYAVLQRALDRPAARRATPSCRS